MKTLSFQNLTRISIDKARYRGQQTAAAGGSHSLARRMRKERLQEQNNKCALCGVNILGIRTHWDHCHDAEPYLGKIDSYRGMLCSACNNIEGQLRAMARRSGMSRKNCVVKLLQHSKMHAEHWPEGTL